MAEIIKRLDSRRTFVNILNKLAETDKDIIVIIPDVGFLYLDGPQNFKVLNLGATEQSCVMIATGLALSGKKVYVYSMINFVLFRPAEMVRNGIVNHKANVKLIGVKGSEKYKFLGFSHNLVHGKEDINFCENIGLNHYGPQENEEVKKIIEETYQTKEACYIRL